ISVTTDKTVTAFTNKGNAFKIDPTVLGDFKWKDKGLEFAKTFGAADGEKVIAMFDLSSLTPETNLLFFTRGGMIKKTAVSEYGLLKSTYQAVKLKDDDELIAVEVDETADSEVSILFVTKDGMGLNAATDDIPLQGRVSGGVKGMMLGDGDFCTSICQVRPSDYFVVVTNKGFAKKVISSEVDKLARYRKGVKVVELKGDSSNGTCVMASGKVTNNHELVVVTEDDASSLVFEGILEDTRSSKGSRIAPTSIDVKKANIRVVLPIDKK
ncbi:MAG: hypothetical protein IJW24_03065, partial [Clostridia bacterium]|nr:hypothetical protein [Clostridia bacterium]